MPVLMRPFPFSFLGKRGETTISDATLLSGANLFNLALDERVGMAALNETQAIVYHYNSADTLRSNLRIVEVSSIGGINLGTELVSPAAESSDFGSGKVRIYGIERLTNTEFIIAFQVFNSPLNTQYVAKGTVSGTTISVDYANKAIVRNVSTSIIQHCITTQLSTNKVAIIMSTGHGTSFSSGQFRRVITVSGSSITVSPNSPGDPIAANAASTISPVPANALDVLPNDKIRVVWKKPGQARLEVFEYVHDTGTDTLNVTNGGFPYADNTSGESTEVGGVTLSATRMVAFYLNDFNPDEFGVSLISLPLINPPTVIDDEIINVVPPQAGFPVKSIAASHFPQPGKSIVCTGEVSGMVARLYDFTGDTVNYLGEVALSPNSFIVGLERPIRMVRLFNNNNQGVVMTNGITGSAITIRSVSVF